MQAFRFLVLTFACAALAIGPGQAQNKYPVSTVTLVTHSSPGSGSDVFLRELIRHLGPEMGVSFVVENVRGGSGATAVAKVARGPADGSMFYATTPTYIQTTLLSKPQFGYDSLDPLVTVFFDPEVIFVRTESPFRSLKDVVAYSQKNIGRAKWGAANPGSLERIALERMSKLLGARAAIVTHEGGGDLLINVLNGTLDIGVGEIQEVSSQLEAKKVRLLASLTDQRIQTLPDLKTAKEEGVDLVVTKFRGLAGPKGVPDAVAAQWEAAMKKVLAKPEYKAVYEKENLIVALKGRAESRSFTTAFAKEVETTLRDLGVVK
ncbi:MAG: tripartite tricarboxylate transporter substrate binding protein [Alphaproteobacteria bacterium]|nr:tripartite tricarboxylate transporter substrate binding protein [Alphaproteobacteria bacterium]